MIILHVSDNSDVRLQNSYCLYLIFELCKAGLTSKVIFLLVFLMLEIREGFFFSVKLKQLTIVSGGSVPIQVA